jgi:hypothetical protein
MRQRDSALTLLDTFRRFRMRFRFTLFLLAATFAVAFVATAAERERGSEVQRVYRFALQDGRCSLEAIEDVRGDFRRSRVAKIQPGMLSFRVLNSRDEVVAEEAIRAPDYVCVALDPNTSADGKPTAAQLTSRGPVVFQVRMPIVADAALMKIYRVEGTGGTARDAEPGERLLATIPLTTE